MNWVIVGAGSMGVALAIEGSHRGMGAPLFVERSADAASRAKAVLARAGLDCKVVRAVNDVDFAKLGAEIIYFAAPWKAVRTTQLALLDRLQALNPAPAIIGLGSARLDRSDKEHLAKARCKILLGAGLEPGLIEALITSVAAERPESVDITTMCGGIPAAPQPPLFFHRQFGARPHFERRDAYRRVHGAVQVAPRFQDAELLHFPGVGILEAFDDAMLPDTAADNRIEVPSLAQKTLRWPNYAQTMRLLHFLGLLDDREIEVDGHPVNIGRTVEQAICPEAPDATAMQVLVAVRALGPKGEESALFLSCTGDAEQTVSPMGLMTALPALAAFECLKTAPRLGLYLPSDPALRAVAPLSLDRFACSGAVRIAQSGAPLNLIATR